MGLAWASGISLYAALLMLGILGISGILNLPASLEILQNPIIITVAAVMYAIEFIVVRIAYTDTGWDIVHSFTYIGVGALLAAAAINPVDPASPVLTICVGVIGGWVTSVSHDSRLARENHGSLPSYVYPRWVVAISGDAIVIAGLWTCLQFPLLFALLLILFLLFSLISN